MRLPSRATVPLLTAALLPAGFGNARATEWHVRAETRLTADRWQGTVPEPVDRLDVRPRLYLGAWDLEGDGAETQRFSFVADLEIAADFGPTDLERRATQDRRALFDLYQAHFRWRERLPAGVTTDLRVGRHLLVDALAPVGLDALDGATFRLGFPFVTVEGSGGLAVRREWNGLGPDVFAPDGTALPTEPAYVVGAAVESANLEVLQTRFAWRRQFEATDAVQREELGGAVELMPIPELSLATGTRYDLMYRWTSELFAEASYGDADLWRMELAWRWERPTFGADSIWNAFSVEPWHDFTVRGRLTPGLWHFVADAGARRFDAGPADAQVPGAEAVGAVVPEDARTTGLDRHPIAWDGGARVTRWLDELGELHVGVEGRVGFGYGGQRHYGDVFTQIPLTPTAGLAPLFLTGRLGAVQFDDAQQSNLKGVSGWAVLGTRWQVSETAHFEVLAEGHSSRFTPFRSRVFARATLEEWL